MAVQKWNRTGVEANTSQAARCVEHRATSALTASPAGRTMDALGGAASFPDFAVAQPGWVFPRE